MYQEQLSSPYAAPPFATEPPPCFEHTFLSNAASPSSFSGPLACLPVSPTTPDGAAAYSFSSPYATYDDAAVNPQMYYGYGPGSTLCPPGPQLVYHYEMVVPSQGHQSVIGWNGRYGSTGYGLPRQRSTKACTKCRTRKTKCSGQVPCARCLARGLQCEYVERVATSGSRKARAKSSSPKAGAEDTAESPVVVAGADGQQTAADGEGGAATATLDVTGPIPSPRGGPQPSLVAGDDVGERAHAASTVGQAPAHGIPPGSTPTPSGSWSDPQRIPDVAPNHPPAPTDHPDAWGLNFFPASQRNLSASPDAPGHPLHPHPHPPPAAVSHRSSGTLASCSASSSLTDALVEKPRRRPSLPTQDTPRSGSGSAPGTHAAGSPWAAASHPLAAHAPWTLADVPGWPHARDPEAA